MQQNLRQNAWQHQDSIYKNSLDQASSRQLSISQFMNRTYSWMCLGLFVTGLISFGVVSSEDAISWIFEDRIHFLGILVAEFFLVIGLTALYHRLSAFAATIGFLLYSGLNGLTLSGIFLTYSVTSIGQVFLIAAAMFGAMAVYGTITKRDLTSLGSFFGMGLFGLVLVGVVNLFIGSEALSFGTSCVGVLVFAGLTAYDIQRIRSMAYEYSSASGGDIENVRNKGAVFAALVLYLNFINLFLDLLRILGERRD